MMLPFARVSIIGLGLIGSSVARAVRAAMPTVRLVGHDANAQVRDTARNLDLCDNVAGTPGAAVSDTTEQVPSERLPGRAYPRLNIRQVTICPLQVAIFPS